MPLGSEWYCFDIQMCKQMQAPLKSNIFNPTHQDLKEN